MSARRPNSPDTVALLTLLDQVSELCRSLDLPKDAALFDEFIIRFQKERPTYEVLRDEIYHAINGITGLRIISKSKDDHSEYRRLQLAFSEIAFPYIREKFEEIQKRKRDRISRKAIRDSDTFLAA